jgi:hypothetical protein
MAIERRHRTWRFAPSFAEKLENELALRVSRHTNFIFFRGGYGFRRRFQCLKSAFLLRADVPIMFQVLGSSKNLDNQPWNGIAGGTSSCIHGGELNSPPGSSIDLICFHESINAKAQGFKHPHGKHLGIRIVPRLLKFICRHRLEACLQGLAPLVPPLNVPAGPYRFRSFHLSERSSFVSTICTVNVVTSPSWTPHNVRQRLAVHGAEQDHAGAPIQ